MGTSAFDKLWEEDSQRQTTAHNAFDQLWGADETPSAQEPVYTSARPAAPIRITAPAPTAFEQGIAALSPVAVAAKRQQDEEGQRIFEQMQARVAPLSKPITPAPIDVIRRPREAQQIAEAVNAKMAQTQWAARPTPGMLQNAALQGLEVAEQPVTALALQGAKIAQGVTGLANMLGVPQAPAIADELQRFRDTAERVTAPKTGMGQLAHAVSSVAAPLATLLTLPMEGAAGFGTMAGVGGLEEAAKPDATPRSVALGAAGGAALQGAFEAYPAIKAAIPDIKAAIKERLAARAAEMGQLIPGWEVPASNTAMGMPATPVAQAMSPFSAFTEQKLLPRFVEPPVVGPAIPMRGELPPEAIDTRLAAAAEAAPTPAPGAIIPGMAYEARSAQKQAARMRSIAQTADQIAAQQAGAEASNRAFPLVNEDAIAQLASVNAARENAASVGSSSLFDQYGQRINDVGGAVQQAFQQWTRQDATGRALRGATLAGLGYATQQSDDDRIRKAGTALMLGGGLYGTGALSSETSKAFEDLALRVLAPASRSAESEAMSHIFRANTGQARRAFEQAVAGTQEFADYLNANLSAGQRMRYANDIEGGVAFRTARLRQGAGMIRQILDTTRDQIRALDVGKLEKFYTDYFPHIWEDPTRMGASAQDAILQVMGKRPLGGAKSFLKNRTIDSTLEGMFPQGVPANLAQLDEAGLRAEVTRQGGLMPVTTDPVRLMLIKTREMQKYLMDVKSLQDGEAQGIIKLVNKANPAPQGWARINNPLGTVTGPRNAAGEAIIKGQYYAPPEVVSLIDNYLSPGLRGNKAFDAYRTVGNTLNRMQLGLSAFHLGMTSIDAMVSRNALALKQLADGDITGALKSAATAPVAPVLNYLQGQKVAQAYLDKSMAGRGYDAIADAVADAGGAIKQDSFYQGSAPQKMIDAWKQNKYLGAAAHGAMAAFELPTRLIMEKIVPMQKLGVFADLARYELEKLPATATDAERRAVMAKVWDSVDNRMGQLVYDNLFWNRTFKDLAMASTRSVGWNVGTLRELGGAVRDVATGEGLTHRVAYAASLPISVGMLGAVYQYLATGQGPQELKDYFYPRTGTFDMNSNPNRVQLPSYLRDVRDYATDTPKTLKHKLHPLMQMVADWMTNEDYRGNQIYNPDDGFVDNLRQLATHFGKNALPFSVSSNLAEQSARGASTAQKMAGFVGVTAAPRDVQLSPAQRLMQRLTPKGGGGLTPEDAEAQQERRDVLAQLRGATDKPDALDKALTSGALVPAQFEGLLRRANIEPTQEQFKRLSFRDALRVFNLADDRERMLWADILQKKYQAAQQAGMITPEMFGRP